MVVVTLTCVHSLHCNKKINTRKGIETNNIIGVFDKMEGQMHEILQDPSQTWPGRSPMGATKYICFVKLSRIPG